LKVIPKGQNQTTSHGQTHKIIAIKGSLCYKARMKDKSSLNIDFFNVKGILKFSKLFENNSQDGKTLNRGQIHYTSLNSQQKVVH
jgi:hypothetical protein